RLLDAPTVAAESSGAEASDDGATKGKLRFSRHAASRLHSRGMEVPQEELTRLEDAVDKLAQRGGKESLVLLGERAYIVGVPKRTVITVMPRAEALGTVFTNIDSTYVA
ncbi:MAG: flagellar operon protein, partial [Kiritimatiellia bacterium]